MSATLIELVGKLADALECHAPSDPLIPYARGVIAGVGQRPTIPGRKSGWRKQATAQDRAIAADYEAGLPIEQTAAKHGVSREAVRAAIRRCGGTMRQPGQSRRTSPDPRSAQFWADYQAGQTLEQIGTANHITRERVRQILIKGGYDTKAVKRPVPEAHQRAIDAYLAGDSLHTAAAIAKVCISTMRDIIVRNGHSIRPSNRVKRFDAAKAARVAALYHDGRTVREIGEIMGFASTAVYHWLGCAGVKPSRNRRPRVDTAAN